MYARLSHQETRHIASAMLWVWLFALVASWANACILQPSGVATDARGHPARSHPAAQHVSVHEGTGNASGPHQPDPAQEACASFCDTERSIVAKVQPAKGDGAADPLALVAPLIAPWPTAAPGRAHARWRPLTAPPPPGPPLVIAFLRLTR
jgi:hypothetical protein